MSLKSFEEAHDRWLKNNPEDAISLAKAFERARSVDAMLLDRALGILHRMATERTGWRAFFSRWYYPDEPLRNDAANLVRQARFEMMRPDDTRLVGDDAP